MRVRITAVQYHLHAIDSIDQFKEQVTRYAETAAEYESHFLLFPEFFTTPLTSIRDAGHPEGYTVRELSAFTEDYLHLFVSLATTYRMHIIGGTHIIEEENRWYNCAHLFYPDGRISRQAKLHLTPTEKEPWQLSPGRQLDVFETDWGKVAIIICYDIEFPEVVRQAKALGADIIFCPSCTDDQHGFFRVRYCAHARAIENQVYVVTTGTVGSLPGLDFMRANYGQAAFITPNDLMFPPRGVLMEGEINQDMTVTADFDLQLLHEVREGGSVSPWQDRRVQLYREWLANGE